MVKYRLDTNYFDLRKVTEKTGEIPRKGAQKRSGFERDRSVGGQFGDDVLGRVSLENVHSLEGITRGMPTLVKEGQSVGAERRRVARRGHHGAEGGETFRRLTA